MCSTDNRRRIKDEKERQRKANQRMNDWTNEKKIDREWARDFSAERLTHSRCLIFLLLLLLRRLFPLLFFFLNSECGCVAAAVACRFYFYHFKHKINIIFRLWTFYPGAAVAAVAARARASTHTHTYGSPCFVISLSFCSIPFFIRRVRANASSICSLHIAQGTEHTHLDCNTNDSPLLFRSNLFFRRCFL